MAKSDRNSATARLVEGSPVTYHIDSRFRRNVLDLLTVIGGHAVTGYLFIDVDMSAIEKIRTSLDNSGTKVTVTSFILKAIARAQVSHPASRTFAVPFGPTRT